MIVENFILKGEPKIHRDNLEYIGDLTGYEEGGALYYRKSLFNGISWSEINGAWEENTIKYGLRNGRCIKVHSNGILAKNGFYKDDEPVGKVTLWDQYGNISSYSEHENNGAEILKRNFNSDGVLVKELVSKPNWCLKHWTDSGSLIFETTIKTSKCYVNDGTCVLQIFDRDKLKAKYNNKMLLRHASKLLEFPLDLVKYPILDWLKIELDKKNNLAVKLLLKLLMHPLPSITKIAVVMVEERNYSEAIPQLKSLILRNRTKEDKEDGHVATEAELAKGTLKKLIRSEGFLTKLSLMYFLLISCKKDYTRANTNLRASQRKEIMRSWPEATASFYKTYTIERTLKTANQVLTDQTISRDISYNHIYQYEIDKKTFQAVFNSKDKKYPLTKVLQYREKKPSEYIFK